MSGPKIGLSTLFSLSESFPNLLKQLSKIHVYFVEIVDDGFHALDKGRVEALKKLADSKNFRYSVHSPVADINIASPNTVLRQTMFKQLEKSIHYARQLDSFVWVFHPGIKTGISDFYPGQDWQQNIDSVRVLMKIAKKYDVQIAIENVPEPYPFIMKSVDDFSRFYSELGDNVGLALDIGHAHINNQIKDFLNAFSDRIVHMHISDNDGKSDRHMGIGYGTIEWKRVAEMVKKIGYGNAITLESIEHIEESLQFTRKLFR